MRHTEGEGTGVILARLDGLDDLPGDRHGAGGWPSKGGKCQRVQQVKRNTGLIPDGDQMQANSRGGQRLGEGAATSGEVRICTGLDKFRP